MVRMAGAIGLVGAAVVVLLVAVERPAITQAQSPEPAAIHERSTLPSSARFEIVQSTISAKGTYRVDRFRGNVFQLVQTQGGGLTWDLIPRGAHPVDKVTDGQANYQFFTSGIAMKCTYLLNVNTGATWELVADKDGILSWAAFQ